MRSSTGAVKVRVYDVGFEHGSDGRQFSRTLREERWARMAPLSSRARVRFAQVYGEVDIMLLFDGDAEFQFGADEPTEFEIDYAGEGKRLVPVSPPDKLLHMPHGHWTKVLCRWKREGIP